MLQGIAEGVKKQAEQRINSRITMYVPDIDDLALQRTQRAEQCRMRTPEQGYTQTDMDEFDRVVLERKKYVATPEEWRYYKDQYTVVQPKQGGGSNTVKTK